MRKIIIISLFILILSIGTTISQFENNRLVCKSDMICDKNNICFCKDLNKQIVCDIKLSQSECIKQNPTDSKEYEAPIDCLRDKKYCIVDIEGEDREFYLTKIDCNRTKNKFCDITYTKEIK